MPSIYRKSFIHIALKYVLQVLYMPLNMMCSCSKAALLTVKVIVPNELVDNHQFKEGDFQFLDVINFRSASVIMSYFLFTGNLS